MGEKENLFPGELEPFPVQRVTRRREKLITYHIFGMCVTLKVKSYEPYIFQVSQEYQREISHVLYDWLSTFR